jgi:hypothetical protein
MTRRAQVAVLVLTAAGAVAAWVAMFGTSPAQNDGRADAVADLVRVEAGPKSVTPEDRLARGLLDRSSLKKRADFVTPDGDRFTISEGRTLDGAKTCVISAGRGGAGSACDANALTSSPVLWVESFSAGPEGKDVTNWELSGLAGRQVDRLLLVDSAGHRHAVHLDKSNAFFFAFSRGELKRGLSANSLEVYDGTGKLIDQIAL